MHWRKPLQLTIHPAAATPISEQIRAQLADAIAALELHAGDLLTAPTELAQQLVASPAAVLKAYRLLESSGLCRQGERGFEVAPATLEERRERARRHHLDVDRQSLLEELELARKIQKRLMPPALVEAPGYAVAARVHAAEFVSGDFFEILERGGGVVDVVVADVAGKGVGASLIMALVKARLQMPQALSPALPVAETLKRLNHQLHADLGRRQFVALAYARFFSGSGRLEVANAGLPDPYLLRPGRSPATLVAPGPRLPLGMRPDLDYVCAGAELGEGDRLLLLSDGIPEAPAAAGEPLGYDRLIRLLEAHAGRSRRPAAGVRSCPLEWLDDLLDRIGHATGASLADDQTALVLERRGA